MKSVALAVLLLVSSLAGAGSARADDPPPRTGTPARPPTATEEEDEPPAWPPEEMKLYLGVQRFADPLLVGNTSTIFGAGMGYHTARQGFCAGADGFLGAGNNGGFDYDATLLIGVGGRLGPVMLCATGGINASALTGDRIPLAWAIPVEAFVQATLDPHIALTLWGRPSFVVDGDVRKDGSKLGLGDQIVIGGAAHIRVGEWATLRDLYVSIVYGEEMHTHSWLFAVGLGRTQR